MKLPDKVYDVLKWVVVVFLPALNTFIFALGIALHFDSEVTCGVISAVTVFLGSLIGLSTLNYNKDKKTRESDRTRESKKEVYVK